MMRTKIRSFGKITVVCVIAFCCALVLVSCGYYHMGSMMHPQIKTIAISAIRNDTREPLLTELARTQIAARFQSDNSLKLVSKEEADCILYVRLVSASTSMRRYRVSYNDEEDEYRPAEFHVSLQAEMEVLIPGRSEPLIRKRSVSGSANYQYNVDPQVGKYYGLRQACFELGGTIVEYTTEAW